MVLAKLSDRNRKGRAIPNGRWTLRGLDKPFANGEIESSMLLRLKNRKYLAANDLRLKMDREAGCGVDVEVSLGVEASI